ncbi:hypothetical protein EDD16DRAFT_591705 [Pisolithus croceorrhizus]|nr:hypothetical protein EV401DRAFT_1034222 [Pisolithus croceorrhizus]KAI6124015.1 hypothetical protein EDD16DRAFT_591705 [Pisolithus croceorrhizus]
MSKRKQDTENSDDSDRVKRVKDNSGLAKPTLLTRHTSSTATGDPVARTKATDKEQKNVCDVPMTNATSLPSTPDAGPSTPAPDLPGPPPAPPRKRLRIQKLAPPHPYPTVPLARSATGPRSTSTRPSPDEPLCLCVTRKTSLPVYIRRCTSAFLRDGAREVRLSAMGAAIPHLALLVGSLTTEGILPFAQDELKVEVYTGSEGVVDEVLSNSESESESDEKVEDTPKEEFRQRTKSTMHVIIRHENGNAIPAKAKKTRTLANRSNWKRKRKGKVSAEEREQSDVDVPQRIVIQEPEQEDTNGS